MTTSTTARFRIDALPADVLDDVRAATYGGPVEHLVAEGREAPALLPARCLARRGADPLPLRATAAREPVP